MDYTCTSCSYVGQRKIVNGGSKLGSFMCWFVIPSIWGLFSSGLPDFSANPMEMLQTMQSSGGGGIVQDLIISSIPGTCYSIWRRVKKNHVCPQCGEKIMMPSGRYPGLVGTDISGKDHVVELERKIAMIEREALEKQATKKTAETVLAKPFIQEQIKTPPVIIEPRKVDKNQW